MWVDDLFCNILIFQKMDRHIQFCGHYSSISKKKKDPDKLFHLENNYLVFLNCLVCIRIFLLIICFGPKY